MHENEKICKNCAYAVVRSEATRFKWCKYLCTLEHVDNPRWLPYKYSEDTCEFFLSTDEPRA